LQTIYSKHPKFEILTPGGGEIFKKGSRIHIFWKGGPPVPQSIRLWLVDETINKIIETALPDPYYNNSEIGNYAWTIPKPFKIETAHNFQIYIEDEFRKTWTYGQTFKIV